MPTFFLAVKCSGWQKLRYELKISKLWFKIWIIFLWILGPKTLILNDFNFWTLSCIKYIVEQVPFKSTSKSHVNIWQLSKHHKMIKSPYQTWVATFPNNCTKCQSRSINEFRFILMYHVTISTKFLFDLKICFSDQSYSRFGAIQ